jgi:hypothetical protein
MGHMAPPEQHVGVVEDRIRQPLVGIVERAAADFEVGMSDAGSDRTVDAIRINLLHLLV